MPRGVYPRRQATDVMPAAVVNTAPASSDPLQRNRRVQDMGEAELRAYAVQIGISPREAREVSVERLRSNCLHRIYDLIEEL